MRCTEWEYRISKLQQIWYTVVSVDIAAVFGLNQIASMIVSLNRYEFSLEDGFMTYSSAEEVQVNGTISNGLPVLSIAGNLLLVAGVVNYFTKNPNGTINTSTIEVQASAIDMNSGYILWNRQFAPPANIGLVDADGFYYRVLFGNLFDISITYYGNYTATFSDLIYIPANKTLLSAVNSTLGSTFDETGGMFYFAEKNLGGGTIVSAINLSSFNNTTILNTELDRVSSLTFTGDSFLAYSNGSIAALSLNGTVMWQAPMPEYGPPGFGYITAPVLSGNGTLLIASTIDSESVAYYSYSQEFELLNLSTGATVSVYFNNFTLTPVGNPPGLPPSPNVYTPLAISGGVLIYTTDWGAPELYGTLL